VSWDVAMSFFVSVVFWDIVKVVPSDHNCPLHLGRNDDSLQNLASDGDVTGEGALFVDIVGFNGFLGSLECESNILVVSNSRRGLLGE